MQLSECNILLTGATGGIGRVLAERLCSGGARLLLVGRQAARLEQLVAQCHGRADSVCADITQSAGREAVVQAAQRFGGINLLINAAGVNHFNLLEQHDEEALAALVQLNVTATLQLTHRLLPLLRQQRRALVANIGSTFGSIGYPGFAAYCASKFALRGFSEALRRELADTNVKVMYIAPRATRTEMNEQSVVAMNNELKVTMDEPAVVAKAVVAAIGREREELYLGWPEKLFIRLNCMLPRLVDQALRKQLPIIQRFARNKS